MAQNPNILSPRQPLATYRDQSGNEIQILVDRSWWRFFNDLNENSGSLSAGVTIAPNSVITAGTINAGSTVTPADMPTGTLLGNSSGAAAPATAQVVGGNLELNAGTLDAAAIPGLRLLGNSNASAAKPVPIQLGAGLVFSGDILNVSTSGGVASIGLMETIAYWRP